MTSSRIRVSVGLFVLVALGSSDGSPVRAAGQAPVAEFVAEIRSGPGSSTPIDFKVFNDALYFSANDGVNGDELWRLDTNGVATLVADINPGSDSSGPRQLTVAGDRLYFVASRPAEGRELWQYDGVNPPTLAADIWAGSTTSFIQYMTSFGNEVVFRANNGTGDELFRFRPVGGLERFDIWRDDPSCDPAGGGCGSDPDSLTVYNGVLYFAAFEPTAGTELYGYDGTTPRLLSNLGPGASSAGAQGIIGLGNRLVFGAFDFGQYRLFSYDIATGVGSKISDVVVNDTRFRSGTNFASLNGAVYLAANDGINGEELWKTDGTPAGTQLAWDVNPGSAGSNPRELAVFNGELYFSATDAAAGTEIRATNGTAHRLLADLIPGTNGIRWSSPTPFGEYLAFSAVTTGQSEQPWATTGTTAGTAVVVKSDGTLIKPAASVDGPEYTLFNGALYFAADDGVGGYELWRLTYSAATPTTTTLTSSLNPSIAGELVTFTATVTGASPTGTVTFRDGATPIGSVALVSGIAQLSTTSLAAGNHAITAEFGGDLNDAPSTSSALVQVVDPAATTTALSSSPNPSTFGQGVTLTAVVTGGTPTGTVTFFDGGTPLDVVPLAGTLAIYLAQGLTGGSHNLSARYSGDTDDSPSTSNVVVQVVNRVGTSTALSSTPNPSLIGGAVEFTAVVTPGSPTGSIVFADGGVTLATVALVANTASVQISTLTPGPHNIVGTYSGDTNYANSTSNVVTQVVNDTQAPPVANSQSVTTPEDTARGIVLGASDANNDPLTFSVVTPPTFGALSGQAPNLLYTPNANYFGLDSFTFKANDGFADSNVATVSITVTPVNDPPVAVNDSYVAAEDTALIVPAPGVLGNDSDVDSSALTTILVNGPVHGVLVPSPSGGFTYTPLPNFFGPDSFTYRASDGALTSGLATVAIAVAPVNDPPAAANDSYTTVTNAPLNVAAPGVLSNDSDVDGTALTAALVSNPGNGTVTLNANGSFTYTPFADFTGSDAFTYRASDGASLSNTATVTVTVTPLDVKWTLTGTLGARRRFHTATLLPNGKVLVAGGHGQGNKALDSSELYDPATGTWSATGNLITKRGNHTATLLPNGEVLVAGGEFNGFLVNNGETYNPATGTWSATGAIPAFPTRHTATLLPNGKVLVFGGLDSTPSSTAAELYDPISRTWWTTGSLSVGRNFHTATLLSGGKVLAVGGYGIGGAVTSVEMYDSASGTWSSVASLGVNRTGHTATVLPNGKVLIAGGGNNAGTLATAELFDPVNGTWTPTGALNSARIQHSATLLFSGKVLVAGGTSPAGALTSSELYDPSTGQWIPTASLNVARVGHGVTLLPNGRLLATGGNSSNSVLDSAELYGPASQQAAGTWNLTGSLKDARFSHTATLLTNGKVLVAGGLAGNAIRSAELYDPAIGTWSATGNMTTRRVYHAATLLPDGRVLVTGGSSQNGAEVNTAEIYNPVSGTWSSTGNLKAARSGHIAVVLPNGKVLVAGGATLTAPVTGTEIYDPVTGQWTSAGNLATGRAFPIGVLLPNGKVLVAGGTENYLQFIGLSSAELYDPATGTWSATGSLNVGRWTHSAALLPNGKVLVAGGLATSPATNATELYDPSTGTWSVTGTLNTARNAHASVVLPTGKVLVSGGFGTTGSISEAEFYDGATGVWTPTSSLTEARANHTMTLLPNGKVLAASGTGLNGRISSAEIYTPE